MVDAADARERVEWHRTVGLAQMVSGMFGNRDPWEVVPARYRPGAVEDAGANPSPGPPLLTDEERAIREEVGLANLGAGLRQLVGG